MEFKLSLIHQDLVIFILKFASTQIILYSEFNSLYLIHIRRFQNTRYIHNFIGKYFKMRYYSPEK